MAFTEPTLEDLLSDPLAISLMAADRVDPAKLRIDLSHVARRVVPIMAQNARAARRIADLLADCVAIADKAARAQGQGKSEWHGEGRSLAAPGADPQW